VVWFRIDADTKLVPCVMPTVGVLPMPKSSLPICAAGACAVLGGKNGVGWFEHSRRKTDQGPVRLQLRQPWRDGTRDVVFDPPSFWRLAVLVPRPYIT
jgi:hypothetical protein